MRKVSDWSVEFYEDGRGNFPAYDFIQGLDKRERASIWRVIDRLKIVGVNIGYPQARQIERGLWELRVDSSRLLYVAHTGRRFIILHGFKKKTRKTPKRHIDTAMNRWKDFLEND